MEQSRPEIKEVIVVEGRDDTNAIQRAVRAVTIETHGFGISKDTWDKLDNAYKKCGLIVFTDPDHAGKEIRKRLLDRYPDAKEAFLLPSKATSKKLDTNTGRESFDIGIENASPEDIIEALTKARARALNTENRDDDPYEMSDLVRYGLVGRADSATLREELGDRLGIGYYNGKGLLKVLNGMRIPKEEFEAAMESVL